MARDFDIVVVGGGHNGLVASTYLAKAGLKVGLFERRDIVGGACVTEELWPGHHLSTCSYYCYKLNGRVIEDLELERHGLAVIANDPELVGLFPGGRVLRSWRDEERYLEDIAVISRADATAYPRFRSFKKSLVDILDPYMLTEPPTLARLVDDARAKGQEDVLERLLFGTVTGVVEEFFESEEMKVAVATAGDMGDPDGAGTLLGLAYFWHSMTSPRRFVGLVRGGMGGITGAIAASAVEAGVSIVSGREVTSIRIVDGAAAGVILADGSEVSADLVVSNADPKRTLLGLVPPGILPPATLRRVTTLSTRAGSLKFHAILRELPDFSSHFGPSYDPTLVAAVRICPSIDHFRRSWYDAQLGRYSRTPVLNVQIPTVYDDTIAPAGHHLMSVWVQYAPVEPREGDWSHLRPMVLESVLEGLSAYAPNIRSAIVESLLITPADMEDRLGMTRGNIRHLDMMPAQMLANRPLPGWGYRTPVDGLYLCGAGTHPGGDVTGMPGHNAAHVILSDLHTG